MTFTISPDIRDGFQVSVPVPGYPSEALAQALEAMAAKYPGAFFRQVACRKIGPPKRQSNATRP
jgi:hypothetical protein